MAIFGVLLHAGIVARHNGFVLQSKLLHQELAVALGVICHSDGSISRRAVAPGELPAPAGTQGECPICMGGSAVAILPTHEFAPVVLDGGSARVALIAEIVRQRLDGLMPPPRGPPEFA